MFCNDLSWCESFFIWLFIPFHDGVSCPSVFENVLVLLLSWPPPLFCFLSGSPATSVLNLLDLYPDFLIFSSLLCFCNFFFKFYLLRDIYFPNLILNFNYNYDFNFFFNFQEFFFSFSIFLPSLLLNCSIFLFPEAILFLIWGY